MNISGGGIWLHSRPSASNEVEHDVNQPMPSNVAVFICEIWRPVVHGFCIRHEMIDELFWILHHILDAELRRVTC